MMLKTNLRTSVVAVLAMAVMTACGGGAKPMTVADLPAYPGATEIKGNIADTLAKNMQQDAAIRQAMNTGGKTEQKGFQLPKDAKWSDVQKFYEDKLKASGFQSGLTGGSGVVGGLVGNMVNNVVGQVNKDNDLFQTAFFSKDKQVLTMIMITTPTNKDDKQLIFSLTTN